VGTRKSAVIYPNRYPAPRSTSTRKTEVPRRKQKRYFVKLVARPGVLSNPEKGTIAMRVLDISLTGLRVLVPCQLKPLIELGIEFEGALLRGIVRHCQYIGAAEFGVGIWLPDCDPEKPETINPQHLRLLQIGTEMG